MPEPPPEPGGRVRFGAFEVDSARELLLRDGHPVEIQNLVWRLLSVLLERPGELVHRETLVQRLWGGTYVDAESGLNTAIRKLRDALGDDPERPRYVETVPRRGYRLVARIESAASREPPRGRSLAAAVLTLCGLVAMGVGAAALRSLGAPPARPRLVTLPFEARGPESDLAAVISDTLTVHLGRIDPEKLEVLGPVSARILGSSADPLRGAADLGVTHVLGGRLALVGGRIKATVHLARRSDGVEIWGEMFDLPGDDPAGAEAAIVTLSARATASRLGLRDPERLARAGTTVTPAFQAFVRGRAAWLRFDQVGLRESRDAYRAAVAADPHYLDARVGLAEAAALLGLFGFEPPGPSFSAAEASARQAIAQAPDDGPAHAVLGLALLYGGASTIEAGEELEKALRLDPGRAIAHQWVAGVYAARGQLERALEEAREAQSLEPLAPSVNADLCWYAYFARRFGEAQRQAERAAARGPGSGPLVCGLLAARAAGDASAEVAAQVELLRRSDAPDGDAAALREAVARGGVSEARTVEATLTHAAEPSAMYRLAAVLAAQGDSRAAFQVLRTAAAQRVPWRVFLDVDPAFDSLHVFPEFRQIEASR